MTNESKKKIIMKIKFQNKDNENTKYQNMCDVAKPVTGEKFIT